MKEILNKLLKKHKIEIADDNWSVLLKFATKKGLVDFRFFLDVFK
jgi:hypothetical protein